MKTILISGGAGYLGTELTKFLLKKYKVVVFDNFNFPWMIKNKKKIFNHKNLSFKKKNIKDVNITDFFNVDYVCDLNGIPNDPASEINPHRTWEINYKARVNFARIAKLAKVKRYIFNSTCSVFGRNDSVVYENSVKRPVSTYAKANLSAENKIFQLRSKNFKVNILRNSTLFGFSNSMRLDLVINIYVYNLIKGKKIIVDGDGRQWRPFISVNDICKIYNYVLTKKKLPSFKCNLVAFNSTVKEILNEILKVLPSSRNITIFNNKNFDKRNYKVGSKVFKKYFKNFRFTVFSKEINNLKKKMISNKTVKNKKNIRVLFYKKFFSKNASK